MVLTPSAAQYSINGHWIGRCLAERPGVDWPKAGYFGMITLDTTYRARNVVIMPMDHPEALELAAVYRNMRERSATHVLHTLGVVLNAWLEQGSARGGSLNMLAQG